MQCKFPGRPPARARKRIAPRAVLHSGCLGAHSVLCVYAKAALALLWLA